MFEKLMGNRRIIDPSKEEDEVLRFSANISSDAKSILQGVSIIFLFLFYFYFNYAQVVVVVVGFMTLYTNDKTWYTVSHTGM